MNTFALLMLLFLGGASGQTCGFAADQSFIVGDCSFNATCVLPTPLQAACVFKEPAIKLRIGQSKYYDPSGKSACVGSTYAALTFVSPETGGRTSAGLQTFQGGKFLTTPPAMFVGFNYGFSCGGGIVKLSCFGATEPCAANNITVTFYKL
jgi:hypothetical protein